MEYRYLAKTIVRNKKGLYLVLRRSATDSDSPGRADLPGGGIDEDENPHEAAIREAVEEAGLDIDNDSLQLRYAFTKPKEDKVIVRYLYRAQIDDQVVALSHEHDLFWWVDRAEFVARFVDTSWGEAVSFLDDNNLL